MTTSPSFSNKSSGFKQALKATLPPAKMREIILQTLYALNQNVSPESLYCMIMETVSIPKKQAIILQNYANEIFNNTLCLDDILLKTLKACNWNSVNIIEKNILRLILFEYFFFQNSQSILIGEALRLTKKFGQPEASKFIHSLLNDIFSLYTEHYLLEQLVLK